ncbi:integrase [Streptomyces sp. NPDC052095]|uniref:integrase n=1 Tax=unclassified Streptomyces TaxID=2593676 RepID=UPI00344D69C2
MAASHDQYRGRGRGDVVVFAACTAARIGEISGCLLGDIDTTQWTWTVRRQATPAPGGLTWFADAGVHVHALRGFAGHGSLTTTQRYPHPGVHKITAAGTAPSAHFSVLRAPRSLP